MAKAILIDGPFSGQTFTIEGVSLECIPVIIPNADACLDDPSEVPVRYKILGAALHGGYEYVLEGSVHDTGSLHRSEALT